MESEIGKTKSCLKKIKANKIFCTCVAKWRNWDPATQLLLSGVVVSMQSSKALCGIISSFLEVESLYIPCVVNGVNMLCVSVDASRAVWIYVHLLFSCSFFWDVLNAKNVHKFKDNWTKQRNKNTLSTVIYKGISYISASWGADHAMLGEHSQELPLFVYPLNLSICIVFCWKCYIC